MSDSITIPRWQVDAGNALPCARPDNAELFHQTQNDHPSMDRGLAERRAKSVCKRECPRIIDCQKWALSEYVTGVAGGLTDEERHRLGSPTWRHRASPRERAA